MPDLTYITKDETPKKRLLAELKARFGTVHKLSRSNSLFELGNGCRIYVRYSRVHDQSRTFYGLRREDLAQLEGRVALICFLWDDQSDPLFVPFSEYEHVFSDTSPAPDGQYKVQVFLRDEGTEFYIARAGRFNVDAYMGWSFAETAISNEGAIIPVLNHGQIQTLLGSIGAKKGFAVWIPQNNRAAMDWSITRQFECCDVLPPTLAAIQTISQEIDVIWLKRGNPAIGAMFEVEHSTAIYSGLLRFNDVYLTMPSLVDRFMVVANNERRDRFVRQLSRPTFQTSGLAERCSFMQYGEVFRWHYRLHN